MKASVKVGQYPGFVHLLLLVSSSKLEVICCSSRLGISGSSVIRFIIGASFLVSQLIKHERISVFMFIVLFLIKLSHYP